LHGRLAYTLAELLVSLAAASILLTGLASTVVVASRALPADGQLTSQVTLQSEVLDQLAADLQYARYVTERTAHTITFVVRDRNGDGSSERIRYAWSGTAGDPLTRQYNGGSAATVLENVQQFDLAYVTKSVVEQYPGPPVEGPEVSLASFTSAANIKEYKIESNKWLGQYFRPSTGAVPFSSLSWRVTRVRFVARREGGVDGWTLVQIRTPKPDMTPSGVVLGQQAVDENALPPISHSWVSVDLSNMPYLRPGEGACLVLQHDSGGQSANVRYDENIGSGRLTTGNGGSTWACDSNKSMYYYVYGKVATPGPTQTATRQYVTSVRAALRAGCDPDARLDAGIRLLNAPEVLSAVWETDFDANPTTSDISGDGQADWARRDGQPFDAATLVGGVWQADTTLDTSPSNNFTALTTVEVRFRNTTMGGNGAVFWINADWSGSNCAPIFAFLQLQSDGTQTLTAYHKLDNSTPVPLTSVRRLSAGFITLRLLIDPALNTVNVKVNGLDQGTYSYNVISVPNNDRYATLLPWGSSAQFDSVSVRVGGS
jgi:Tfp pilus assembly protein FimT